MLEGWRALPGSFLVAALPSATCQGGGGCSCPFRCPHAASPHGCSPPCFRKKGWRWVQALLEVFVLKIHADKNDSLHYFIKGFKMCFLNPESSMK